ncbi:MAG: hypothetical protein U9N40_01035, partial [Euryarchaeota archaeon]|nr:hypothetical protein [Euryarchaeota archaeon]
GYAVESGLPYVNPGIIAALAGMDISDISEPSSYLPLLKERRNRNALTEVKEMAARLRQVHRENGERFL